MTGSDAIGERGSPSTGDPESRKLADRARRRQQAAVAGHRGDIATIRPLLDDPDGAVRATALGALARAGALRPDDLERAGADPSSAVRRRTAELLARRPTSDEAEPLLLALLDDADDTVVDVAAWSAGEVWQAPEDDPPTVPEAILARLSVHAVDHADSLVREAAVAALGSIGHEGAVPAILAACSDRAPVRRRAVLALAPFAGPEVDAALERAKSDRDWQVRQAADDLS